MEAQSSLKCWLLLGLRTEDLWRVWTCSCISPLASDSGKHWRFESQAQLWPWPVSSGSHPPPGASVSSGTGSGRGSRPSPPWSLCHYPSVIVLGLLSPSSRCRNRPISALGGHLGREGEGTVKPLLSHLHSQRRQHSRWKVAPVSATPPVSSWVLQIGRSEESLSESLSVEATPAHQHPLPLPRPPLTLSLKPPSHPWPLPASSC